MQDTAIKWFMRLQQMDAEHPDRSRFEAWLMADPSHQQAYAEVEQLWQKLDSTSQVKQLSSAMDKMQATQSRRKFKAVATAFSIMIALTASLLGYRYWQTQPVMEMVATVGIGDIKSQQLEDGSKLTLNANTDVEITYYRHQRVIKLKRGEAIFDVAPDVDRPFIVDSGHAKVTVLGTRFAVNKFSTFVRVSVDHGRVRVEPQDGSANAQPSVLLVNGEVVEVKAGEAPKRIARPAEDAFSFEDNVIVFKDAGFDEIAETLSRYRAPSVVSKMDSAQKGHITAVIQKRNVEKFLRDLPGLAAVKVINETDQTKLASNISSVK
ncbi:MAG: FecR family protein [Methylophilaceae bacterium]